MTTKFPTPNLDEAAKQIQSYDAEVDVREAVQADIALAVEAARVEVPEDVREAALNAITSEKAHYLNQEQSPRVLLELENLERARRWLESLRPAKASEEKSAERNWKAEVAAIAHALGIEYVPDDGGTWPGELEPMLNRIRDLYDIEDAWAAHSMGELVPAKPSEPEQPKSLPSFAGELERQKLISARLEAKGYKPASAPVEKRCGTCAHWRESEIKDTGKCSMQARSSLLTWETKSDFAKDCLCWKERT